MFCTLGALSFPLSTSVVDEATELCHNPVRLSELVSFSEQF